MSPSTSPQQPAPARVLCISGHDPSGGAGLQADLETVAALGGQACGVITALTVQNSWNVRRVVAVDAVLFAEQLDCLLADVAPQAIKLGLIGSTAQLPAILAAIKHAGIPVICDPVLRAGGGADLVQAELRTALRNRLFPQVTVLTPNAAEARRLVPEAATLDDCAGALIEDGCANVLITGGDEPDAAVINRWYAQNALPQRFCWPRLPEIFHGAGCTLASAIATFLAQGLPIGAALEAAQSWTQQALQQAIAIGQGRRIPLRRSFVQSPVAGT